MPPADTRRGSSRPKARRTVLARSIQFSKNRLSRIPLPASISPCGEPYESNQNITALSSLFVDPINLWSRRVDSLLGFEIPGSCPTFVRGKNTERGLPAEAARNVISDKKSAPDFGATLPACRPGHARSTEYMCPEPACQPRAVDTVELRRHRRPAHVSTSADARRLCVITARPPSGARRETRTHGPVTPPQPLARVRVRSRESNERRPPAPCSA